ncbi:PssD/Cps14F family polysaccharide biosynthesis glycosyltransferase [Aerococcus urinaeequi]|uniref:PssD/Cps14F family polysaccharide biosynthesis glycosyltransferase n=1 Tax=Aerococcus urinaeequi TaxID=51665 RepID=UPI003B3A4D7D
MTKICLVSSSGGHYEQLRKLKKLEEKYDIFFITEKTDYKMEADYFLPQTGSNDKKFIFKMLLNTVQSLKIWIKEKPDVVITTGTVVAIPLSFLAKITGRKLVYIETFARVYDGTKAGKLMYKFADLFIIQWETLENIYPDAVYAASIY